MKISVLLENGSAQCAPRYHLFLMENGSARRNNTYFLTSLKYFFWFRNKKGLLDWMHNMMPDDDVIRPVLKDVCYKTYQDASGCIRMYQDVSGCIRTYQDVSVRIRTYQNISGRFSTYQDVIGRIRTYQDSIRTYQDVSGRIRTCQDVSRTYQCEILPYIGKNLKIILQNFPVLLQL